MKVYTKTNPKLSWFFCNEVGESSIPDGAKYIDFKSSRLHDKLGWGNEESVYFYKNDDWEYVDAAKFLDIITGKEVPKIVISEHIVQFMKDKIVVGCTQVTKQQIGELYKFYRDHKILREHIEKQSNRNELELAVENLTDSFMMKSGYKFHFEKDKGLKYRERLVPEDTIYKIYNHFFSEDN